MLPQSINKKRTSYLLKQLNLTRRFRLENNKFYVFKLCWYRCHYRIVNMIFITVWNIYIVNHLGDTDLLICWTIFKCLVSRLKITNRCNVTENDMQQIMSKCSTILDKQVLDFWHEFNPKLNLNGYPTINTKGLDLQLYLSILEPLPNGVIVK